MLGNVSLSPKQSKLLSLLLDGQSIVAAAKAVGITQQTAHRWRKEPAFQAAYQAEQQKLFTERLTALRLGVCKALATLARNMGEDVSPSVQVRAAQIWLEQAIVVHKASEVDLRLEALEARSKGEVHDGEF